MYVIKSTNYDIWISSEISFKWAHLQWSMPWVRSLYSLNQTLAIRFILLLRQFCGVYEKRTVGSKSNEMSGFTENSTCTCILFTWFGTLNHYISSSLASINLYFITKQHMSYLNLNILHTLHVIQTTLNIYISWTSETYRCVHRK